MQPARHHNQSRLHPLLQNLLESFPGSSASASAWGSLSLKCLYSPQPPRDFRLYSIGQRAWCIRPLGIRKWHHIDLAPTSWNSSNMALPPLLPRVHRASQTLSIAPPATCACAPGRPLRRLLRARPGTNPKRA